MSITARIAVGRMLMFVALTAFTLVGHAALAAPAHQATAKVVIEGFKFDPPTLTVAAGTTVTWTNLDTAPHTATSTTAGKFDTGNLEKDDSKAITLNEVGTFEYFCQVHPKMLGTIIVTAAAAAPAPVSAPADLPNTGTSDSTGLLAGFGLLALLGGLALTWSSRRRTTFQ